jgi:hypothetical protein
MGVWVLFGEPAIATDVRKLQQYCGWPKYAVNLYPLKGNFQTSSLKTNHLQGGRSMFAVSTDYLLKVS